MKTALAAAAIALALLPGSTTTAAAKGAVQLHIIAQTEREIVNARGEKEIVLVEAARVTPGDEVIYSVSYANSGPEAASDVVITNPVPEHMVCVAVPPSDRARITLSIDGGALFDALESLFVTDEAGNKRPATLGDCTHIRWRLEEPLPSGASGNVSFRAVLQ